MSTRRIGLALATFAGMALGTIGNAQAILTFAGGGAFVNEPASSVAVPQPRGTAVAPDGSVYYAAGNSIYHVNLTMGTATLVAGAGVSGYAGDGGPATLAQLSSPSGMAVDMAGNLYIADMGNSAIRRVDATSGAMTTVAGNGISGYRGDGGPAANAELSYPNGIGVDAAGNVYIADSLNRAIRRVNVANGTITTVAGNGSFGYSGDGGPATSAQLSNAYGITVDAAGDLYIADTNNQVIRRVDAASGIITTVAGTPHMVGYQGDGGPATNALLSNPFSVGVDAGANLYIADTFNQVVRRVDAASGTITTAAGNGTRGYSGNGGPATSAQLYNPYGVAVDAAANVYVADEGNNLIRRVDAASTIITAAAGNTTYGYGGDGGPATGAQLYNPYGIAVDGAANIYIADHANQVVRRVAASSAIITTIAGNGTLGYGGDGGPATAAYLSSPSGIVVDTSGNVYIADTANNVVRRVDAASGNITTAAGNGTHGYEGDGGPANVAQLSYPSGIALDAANDLYVADTYNNVIRRIDAVSGVITTVAGNNVAGFSGDGGPAASARLFTPYGVAFDSAGNLYIADGNNNVVRRVDAASKLISTIAGNGTDGYSGDGGAATAAELSVVTGVTVDPAGNIYVADEGNSVIRRVDAASATISTVAGNGTFGFGGDGGPAASALLSSPYGIALDATGALYISDLNNQRIRRVAAIDSSPPLVTPSVVGTLGSNGWYTSNVTVSWTVSDPSGPITSENGCGMTVISTDTLGKTLKCTAIGQGGSATGSVTIKRDATPPVVHITTPANGAAYAIGSAVNAAYSCTDKTSGVASCMGPLPVGGAIDTSTPGTYSFVVTGTDVAANSTGSTVNYTVSGTATSFTLTPGALSFGMQAINTQTPLSTVLKNTGNVALPISSIAVSGGNDTQFSQTSTCAASVPIGGNCTITVVFKPLATGGKTSNLTVATGNGSKTVRLTGAGADAAFSMSPTSLAFGNQEKTIPSTPQSVIVTNTGSVGLPITGITLTGANPAQFSAVNGCPSTLATNSTCTITVTFAPTSIGAESAAVKLNVQGGATAQSVPLSGTGTAATYTLTPTALNFGVQAHGTTSAPASITLTNTGPLALSLSQIAMTGPFAQTNNCGTSIPGFGTCIANVTFIPMTKGAKTGTMKVMAGGGAASLTATLSGTGT